MIRTFIKSPAFFCVRRVQSARNEAVRTPIAVLFALICVLGSLDHAHAQESDSVPEGDSAQNGEAAPAAAPPPPLPDFTFKRVTPPKPGATRRITVQIVPQEVQPPAAPTPPSQEADPLPAEPEEVAGFWRTLGTGRSENGPGRILEAMAWFDTADPAPASPPLVDLASIAEEYGRDMLAASIGKQVSPALALAVAWTESSGNASVESPKGAQGLMQLIPATAERFEVKDPFNAQQNLRGGISYLSWLLDRFDGDPLLALAGYNAGERAVERAEDGAGGVPGYPETREYVVKVLSAWRVARGLCLTPPMFVSDGCVFVPIAEN